MDETVVRDVHHLIEASPELTSTQIADQLAIPWFVAEAEGLPARLLQEYLSWERLMESELYRSIFSQGEAQGEARGEARGRAIAEATTKAETIIRILMRKTKVEVGVREQVRSTTDLDTLTLWFDNALSLEDEPSAQRLIDLIRRS